MSIRIYVCGAHSTGKTTLARHISQKTGLPLLSEVARQVLAEREWTIDNLRVDMDSVNDYQHEIFKRQMAIEEGHHSFVSDRAFDNLAYAARHSTIFREILECYALEKYITKVRSSLVFYVRPHMALLAADGVRERTDWEEVIRIDGMIDLLLEWHNIPAIGINELSMKDRLRTAMTAVNLYIERKADPCPDK